VEPRSKIRNGKVRQLKFTLQKLRPFRAGDKRNIKVVVMPQ